MQRSELQRALNINDEKRIPRAQTGRGVPPALLGVAGLTALLVLLPLTYLILRALEADGQNLREIVFRVRTLELLGNTLALTAGVLVGSSLLALPLAWLLARTNLPAKRLIVLLGVLPLAVPGYVGAFAMLGATGPNGVIHVLTGIDFPRPVGYWGAVGVLSLFSFPYLFLNVWAALRGLDPNLEEVARSLGHSRLRVFSSVILPQLRPALYAGGLMIALHVLGDFGVVSLVRFETFSAAIYTQYTASFDRVYAAWLSLMLLGLTIATLVLEARLLRHVRLSRIGSGAARRQTMIRLGAWSWPSLAFVLALGVASLGVPVLTVSYCWAEGNSPTSGSIVWAMRCSIPSLLPPPPHCFAHCWPCRSRTLACAFQTRPQNGSNVSRTWVMPRHRWRSPWRSCSSRCAACRSCTRRSHSW